MRTVLRTLPLVWIVTLFLGVAVGRVSAQAPAAPGSPNPPSGQTGVAATTSVQWGQVAGATSYDVNFGSSNPPTSAQTNLTSLTYQPKTALIDGTTYYWQVIAHNATGQTASPIWSFTVATMPTTAAEGQSVLQNLGFGIALGLEWNVASPDIVNDAEVDSTGIVRVNTRANTNPGFVLEMH